MYYNTHRNVVIYLEKLNEKEWIILLSILLGIAVIFIGVLLALNYKNKRQETTNTVVQEKVSDTSKKEKADTEEDSSEDTSNTDESKNTTDTSTKSNSANTNSNKNSSSNSSTIDSNTNVSSATNSTVTNNTYSEKDTTVINEIEKIEDETIEVMANDTSTSAKEKVKGVFISLVDFVFYNGEIKGITFDELTDKGKEKVLQLVNSLDTKIEKKFPGYKEDISSKAKSAFTKASEVIREGASSFSEFSKEKLGEENYNSILESKDELVTYTKSAASIIKESGGNLYNGRFPDIYEKFRDSN